MRRVLSTSPRWLLALTLLASTLPYPGRAEILDPDAKKHPLLQRFAGPLDAIGVNVMQDWASNVRPYDGSVVAPLKNYQTSLAPKREQWIEDFNSGRTGAIVAHEAGGTFKHDTFFKEWWSKPVGKRIFLSFAREDAGVAKKIRAVLEAQGFVAFTYIKNPGETPSISAEALAKFFDTAGTHLVLDTSVARTKQGVLAETLRLNPHRRLARTPEHPRRRDSQKHVVEIYGARHRCPRTRRAIQDFENAGVKVLYFDVDSNPRASRMLDENSQWLEGGNLLPLVLVDDEFILSTRENIEKATRSFSPSKLSRQPKAATPETQTGATTAAPRGGGAAAVVDCTKSGGPR